MGNGTAVGRVRALGSAREGTHHWWLQRVTAATNFALLLWFVVSLLRLPAYDHQTVTGWLSSPLVAVPMILLVVSTFWHFRLGLQVVLEDYWHDEIKVGGLFLINAWAIGGAALAIFSILKIAFTAGAAS